MPNMDEVNEIETERRLEEMASEKPWHCENKKPKVKFYHESGLIFKVEILGEKTKNYGNTPGREYRLKVLDIIDAEGYLVHKGLEFEVWAADDSGGYSGWHLLDH